MKSLAGLTCLLEQNNNNNNNNYKFLTGLAHLLKQNNNNKNNNSKCLTGLAHLLKQNNNNNNNNNKSLTGLAHLLEHTIFHASELFPTEGFSQFLRWTMMKKIKTFKDSQNAKTQHNFLTCSVWGVGAAMPSQPQPTQTSTLTFQRSTFSMLLTGITFIFITFPFQNFQVDIPRTTFSLLLTGLTLIFITSTRQNFQFDVPKGAPSRCSWKVKLSQFLPHLTLQNFHFDIQKDHFLKVLNR